MTGLWAFEMDFEAMVEAYTPVDVGLVSIWQSDIFEDYLVGDKMISHLLHYLGTSRRE